MSNYTYFLNLSRPWFFFSPFKFTFKDLKDPWEPWWKHRNLTKNKRQYVASEHIIAERTVYAKWCSNAQWPLGGVVDSPWRGAPWRPPAPRWSWWASERGPPPRPVRHTPSWAGRSGPAHGKQYIEELFSVSGLIHTHVNTERSSELILN